MASTNGTNGSLSDKDILDMQRYNEAIQKAQDVALSQPVPKGTSEAGEDPAPLAEVPNQASVAELSKLKACQDSFDKEQRGILRRSERLQKYAVALEANDLKSKGVDVQLTAADAQLTAANSKVDDELSAGERSALLANIATLKAKITTLAADKATLTAEKADLDTLKKNCNDKKKKAELDRDEIRKEHQTLIDTIEEARLAKNKQARKATANRSEGQIMMDQICLRIENIGSAIKEVSIPDYIGENSLFNFETKKPDDHLKLSKEILREIAWEIASTTTTEVDYAKNIILSTFSKAYKAGYNISSVGDFWMMMLDLRSSIKDVDDVLERKQYGVGFRKASCIQTRHFMMERRDPPIERDGLDKVSRLVAKLFEGQRDPLTVAKKAALALTEAPPLEAKAGMMSIAGSLDADPPTPGTSSDVDMKDAMKDAKRKRGESESDSDSEEEGAKRKRGDSDSEE